MVSAERSKKLLGEALFVGRCAGAAACAFLAADWLGLHHPVWATISSIVVSQERLSETRAMAASRLLGSCLGVAIAVAVGTLAVPLGAGPAVQIAVAVALAAVVTRHYPSLRVCMWTCPIVILTATAQVPLPWAGLLRGAETLLGCGIGSALHLLFAAVQSRPRARQATAFREERARVHR